MKAREGAKQFKHNDNRSIVASFSSIYDVENLQLISLHSFYEFAARRPTIIVTLFKKWIELHSKYIETTFKQLYSMTKKLFYNGLTAREGILLILHNAPDARSHSKKWARKSWAAIGELLSFREAWLSWVTQS